MIRVMRFDGEPGARRFAALWHCWEGAVNVSINKATRDKAAMRHEKVIEDGLMALSAESPLGQTMTGATMRAVLDGPQVLSLPQEAHATLAKLLDGVLPLTTPDRRSAALDLVDWVDAAEKVEA